jgi:aerobic-type carbon monoxide dehydrogenase small subunit (CoxS/CutS family)
MSRHKKANEKPGISRRSFLKAAGVAGGAVTAGLLIKPSGRVRAAPLPITEPLGPGPVEVTLEVNGKKRVLKLEPRVTLLEALRDHLGLTGTKRTCDHGECGACTVLVDGRATCACMTLALDAQGKKITTIEGLAQGKTLHALQKAFIDHDAFQCGFCTPGMILSLKALLDKHPRATPEQLKAAVAGNYCRCGALPNILKAGNAVAKA